MTQKSVSPLSEWDREQVHALIKSRHKMREDGRSGEAERKRGCILLKNILGALVPLSNMLNSFQLCGYAAHCGR